jgi:hypothetical protein
MARSFSLAAITDIWGPVKYIVAWPFSTTAFESASLIIRNCGGIKTLMENSSIKAFSMIRCFPQMMGCNSGLNSNGSQYNPDYRYYSSRNKMMPMVVCELLAEN